MKGGCYVIAFPRKRYLALADIPPEPTEIALAHGWRPCVWTADLAVAEKFGSHEAAEMFLRAIPVIDSERNNDVSGLCGGFVKWIPGAVPGGAHRGMLA